MSRREWIQFGREVLTIGVVTALALGPAGCQLGALPPGGGGPLPGDLKKLNGLMINDSPADGLLMAARNAAGDAFFVYGTRTASGRLDEVEQILVRTADGAESFIAFESGRPVHAEGPAGDYLHIMYDEVSTERLAGELEIFSAADGTVETFPFDVDLQQAAEQIAERIEQLTGQEVALTTVEDGQLKTGPMQTRITVFSPLFAAVVLPFVLLIEVVTVIVGQVLELISAVATVAVYSVLLVALAPFFAISELLSGSVINIRVVPLFDAFTAIPPPGTIELRD